jgi:hypothetical protein
MLPPRRPAPQENPQVSGLCTVLEPYRLLADLPVDIAGRLRSDRVVYFPAPPRPARPAATAVLHRRMGRLL